jgi:hypothetical protein
MCLVVNNKTDDFLVLASMLQVTQVCSQTGEKGKISCSVRVVTNVTSFSCTSPNDSQQMDIKTSNTLSQSSNGALVHCSCSICEHVVT